jgi:hypothetical protein
MDKSTMRSIPTGLLVGAVVPALVLGAQLPDRTRPSGFASVNGPTSSRAVAGTFTGNACSAALVLGGMFGLLSGYFDGAPAGVGRVHRARWAGSLNPGFLAWSTQRGYQLWQEYQAVRDA